jgi:hypothetical protein
MKVFNGILLGMEAASIHSRQVEKDEKNAIPKHDRDNMIATKEKRRPKFGRRNNFCSNVSGRNDLLRENHRLSCRDSFRRRSRRGSHQNRHMKVSCRGSRHTSRSHAMKALNNCGCLHRIVHTIRRRVSCCRSRGIHRSRRRCMTGLNNFPGFERMNNRAALAGFVPWDEARC